MDKPTFERILEDLLDQMGAGSTPNQSNLQDIYSTVGFPESQSETQKGRTIVQNSLDYLRVSVKYLLFDLEATRRENSYLKRLLDSEGE